MNTSIQTPANLLQGVDKRIIVAIAGFVVAGIVGATSFAAASPNKGDKPTKEWCAAQGYKNYGQCVSAWANGHGYGGTTNTNNVSVSSSSTQTSRSGNASVSGNNNRGNATSGSTSNSSSQSTSVIVKN